MWVGMWVSTHALVQRGRIKTQICLLSFIVGCRGVCAVRGSRGLYPGTLKGGVAVSHSVRYSDTL